MSHTACEKNQHARRDRPARPVLAVIEFHVHGT